MTRLAALLFLPLACALSAAQPARPPAVEKAKAKFETDVSRADEALLAALDKALAKAGKDKKAAERLAYEKDNFVTHRIVPTAVPAGAYLKQRGQAVAALEKAYEGAARELTKAKKEAEAEALERELGELLKSARGYGLALPDLEGKAVFHLENKGNGLVVDIKDGTNDLVLAPKAGKKRPGQCWLVEREPKGYVFRNSTNGLTFHVPTGSGEAGVGLVAYPSDRTKDTIPGSIFKLTEVRRELVIALATNEVALTATERKEKGVTTVYLTQEKKGSPPLLTQRWVLAEVK